VSTQNVSLRKYSMSVFKNWLLIKRLIEQDDFQQNQPKRREVQAKIQRLYDQAVKLLLGAAKDQTHLNLTDIVDDDAGPGSPPQGKGANVVLKKLQPVFQGMKALGDPSLATKADQTMQYLSKVGNDQKVGPKDTVGQLLQRMFGKDALNTYGEKRWKIAAKVEPQEPTQDTNIPQDATAPPPDQVAIDPTTYPNAQIDPAMVDPNVAAQMPQDPNAAMASALDAGMMDPNAPLPPEAPIQSPGGPMPKKPPGGLAMV
jgi:hypothetical protein